jgi:hypothetical protein
MGSHALLAHTSYSGGAAGRAYNEAAFRHFLDIERKRAEHPAYSVLLVMVSRRMSPGCNATLQHAEASALFSALGASVREADFVGWYRENRVAAAVLTYPSSTAANVIARITGRVVRELEAHPTHDYRSIRVRAVPFGNKAAV